MVQEKKPIEDRRIEGGVVEWWSGGVVEWWSGGERLPGHTQFYIDGNRRRNTTLYD